MDRFLGRKRGFDQHKQRAIDLLSRLVGALDKHGVPYFLISGTLLGLIRHQDFIPWDDDIEIGLWINDRENVIKHLSQFEKKGLVTSITTSDKVGFDLNHKNKSRGRWTRQPIAKSLYSFQYQITLADCFLTHSRINTPYHECDYNYYA